MTQLLNIGKYMDKDNKPNRKPFMTALIPLTLFVLLSYGAGLSRAAASFQLQPPRCRADP